MSEWKLLINIDDFEKHKNILDSMGPSFQPLGPPFQPLQELHNRERQSYKFVHRYTPEKFPCLIKSSFGYDPNGPYYYDHDFIYEEDVSPLLDYLVSQE